jgi:DNA mismatch repair protein MutS2
MDIRSRTLRALEWDKLIQHLAAQCRSPVACEEIIQTSLTEDRIAIERLLAETAEAANLAEENAFETLRDLPDLRNHFPRLQLAATLGAGELTAIRSVLRSARLIKGFIGLLQNDAFPHFVAYGKQIDSISVLHQAIDAAIDDHGEIKDDATSALKELRGELRQLERKIKEELARLIRSSEVSKSLQEPIFTQRSNRYVLPVNANQRSSVPGIVHDSSASGLTVYIEPLSIVELSNNLRVKELEVEREILRILGELSLLAKEHINPLEQSHRTLIELDKIMARARLGIKYDGTIPIISDRDSLKVTEARHPLLALAGKANQVVANDLYLSSNKNEANRGITLVITGPNTGGKTVLLKTIGLIASMLKAGMMLPVAAGSQVKIFSEIFADIGDEQSLEQNLSTFSAHMTNIVQILKASGGGSLVLLDEVGAGTDPKEGSALAQAMMEYLNEAGSLTVVTTHLVELKTLAYTNPAFINGSLEFDEATLAPTYKLRIGVPGSSHATTIAKRLGLTASVVERTQSLLSMGESNIEQSIKALESKMAQAAKQVDFGRRMQEQAANIKAEYESKLDDLKAQTEALGQEYAAKMESEFQTAKALIKQLTAELQKKPGLAKAQSAQSQLETLKKDLDWLKPSPVPSADPSQFVSPGKPVFIKSLNQWGIVDQLPADFANHNDPVVLLHVGSVKIKVSVSDLLPDAHATNLPAKSKSKRQSPTPKNSPILRSPTTRSASGYQGQGGAGVFVRTEHNTLDLRGLRVDEALSLLTRFLDAAQLNQTTPLMVIHGHGTGALKSAVREELARGTYAIHIRPGDSHEGGDGVTIVSFA